MLYLIFERSTGVIVGSLEGQTSPTVMAHHDTIEYDGDLPDFQTVKVVDGVVERNITAEYMESMKRRTNTKIDAARDAAVAVGATTPWGIFQADLQSSTNINGAVSMAILGGEAFSIDWRTADNKTVKLDAKGMIGVGVMVGKFVSAIYGRSWTLKAQVAAATTPEELNAVNISFTDITNPTGAQ